MMHHWWQVRVVVWIRQDPPCRKKHHPVSAWGKHINSSCLSMEHTEITSTLVLPAMPASQRTCHWWTSSPLATMSEWSMSVHMCVFFRSNLIWLQFIRQRSMRNIIYQVAYPSNWNTNKQHINMFADTSPASCCTPSVPLFRQLCRRSSKPRNSQCRNGLNVDTIAQRHPTSLIMNYTYHEFVLVCTSQDQQFEDCSESWEESIHKGCNQRMWCLPSATRSIATTQSTWENQAW